MKKSIGFLSALLLILLVIIPGCAEEQTQELSEWTVMFYFCGSDLESGHGYATGNLEEIMYCLTYDTISSTRLGKEDVEPAIEDVNVVVETGGCKEWHAQDLEMNIRTDVLQRWHFRPARNVFNFVLENTDSDTSMSRLELLANAINNQARMDLVGEVPLASMSQPETLSDFIKWSKENYPAKKYALVMWDHGTGAVNGLLIDELFNGDTMHLDELKTALDDSDVHFEAVIFDACLMASLETAWAIKDSADWMIASEELVAGKGTAMNDWLQQLYLTPQWDGLRLGKWVCDMTQEKYAQEVNRQSEDTLTWSVINLKSIDRLAAVFDRFFEFCDNVYVNEPDNMTVICEVLNGAFEFGLGEADMIDLGRLPYNLSLIMGLDRDLYVELVDALQETVAHNTHGPNRSKAGGISFCYAAGLNAEALDQYARVCPSNHYLALMDAINSNWTAPDWVYEKVERLPEITDLQSYQICIEKGICEDGVPEFRVVDGYASLRNAYGSLYRLNPRTGNVVRLTSTTANFEVDDKNNQVLFSLKDFTIWPAIDDVYICADLISTDYYGGELYNIPIRIGEETYLLRCGVEELGKPPIIYGFWEGYDADSGVFSRNVVPLSKVAGRDYCLLYPIDGTSGSETRYETSQELTMYRSLELMGKNLEPGTYYLDYWVEDIFMRRLPVGRAEVIWDGKNIIVPAGTWEGKAILTNAQK